jgi:hypothetical protein
VYIHEAVLSHADELIKQDNENLVELSTEVYLVNNINSSLTGFFSHISIICFKTGEVKYGRMRMVSNKKNVFAQIL